MPIPQCAGRGLMIGRGMLGEAGMSGSGTEARDASAPARAVAWRGSLRTRIALWAGLVNVVLLVLLVMATAWFARRMILDDARRDTQATTQEAAQRLDDAMHVVTITTLGMADLVATTQLSADELTALFDLGYHMKHVDTIFDRVFG